MKQEMNPMYQAIEEAEEALKALREHKQDEATKHAETAVSASRARSGGSGMSADQTKQLSGGLAPLEKAVQEEKAGKRHLAEEDLVKTLAELYGSKCPGGGHGDGCALTGGGACPNQDKHPVIGFSHGKNVRTFPALAIACE